MAFRGLDRSVSPAKALADFKSKGKRRLIAVQPKQQQMYIDTRNLWKSSTTAQQKQYQSIKTSGLLNLNRRLTFLKFNYRHAEQRDISYPQVFKIINNRKTDLILEPTKIKKRKFNRELQNLCSKVVEEVKQNSFSAQKNWLEDYHESDGIEDMPYHKKKQITIGTMNVNDLWGEKLLQQSLGFLPCKRDRPKMLKFYSTKIKNRRIKTEAEACSQTLFQFR